MLTGAHFLFYSTEAEADRTFITDVLRFRSVELDGGWLIFALPPSELAVHPAENVLTHEHAGERLMGAVLYLMCDDLDSFIRELAAKKVACGPVRYADWGTSTTFALPSGGRIGVYQPTHPTAINDDRQSA